MAFAPAAALWPRDPGGAGAGLDGMVMLSFDDVRFVPIRFDSKNPIRKAGLVGCFRCFWYCLFAMRPKKVDQKTLKVKESD